MAVPASNDLPEHPAVAFVKAIFGDATSLPVFVQSLANDKADPAEGYLKPHLLTRDPFVLVRFLTRYDRARRALYFCVSTLEPGSRTRDKTTVRELACLHQDIDFKDVVEDQPTIYAKIAALRCQPTVLVRSGGGLHLYWCLKESLDARADIERIETALKGLAGIIAGDPAVCEVSRLMRLPGTINSKYGDIRQVVCERLDGPRYELSDLEEFIAETAPVLTRKRREPSAATSREGASDDATYVPDPDPWIEAARELKRPVDIESKLAAMRFPANVHSTQVSVSAALWRRWVPEDEVVALLLNATRQAVGTALNAKWNWKVEEREIRKMYRTAPARLGERPPRPQPEIAPDPEITPELEAPAQESQETSGTTAESNSDSDAVKDRTTAKDNTGGGDGGAGNVVSISGAKAKPKKRAATSQHLILAEAVLSVMRQRDQDLMFTETGDFHYENGLWQLETREEMTAWLNAKLEEGAQGLKLESNNRLINEARSYLLRLPELRKHKVPFNSHGMVPTLSGLVDPLTGAVVPPLPTHYVTWRIELAFNPTALCPWWLVMLDDVFADKPAESRALHIQLLQELLGMGLVDGKAKELSRALVLVGGSNYGKSGLLDVLGGLISKRYNSTPLDILEKNAHATVPFLDRIPWVLHEAFDAGKWLMSSTVKAIISGDGIPINIKGGKQFNHCVTAPIYWGSNTPPQFKEATDAIINRIIVIECHRKFDDINPVGAAIEAKRLGFKKPSHMVLANEGEGVLAWAVEGLKRALERGYFVLPQETRDAANTVRLDSNLVAGFADECVNFNPDGMISTADFSAAFTSWWFEHKGEERAAPASERLGAALRALGDERIAMDRKELRKNSQRYYAGIALNAEGKRHWHNTVTSQAFIYASKTASTSAPDDNPNVSIPGHWEAKETIKAMRAVHEKMGRSEESGHGGVGHADMTGHGGGDRSKSGWSQDGSSEQLFDSSQKPRF